MLVAIVVVMVMKVMKVKMMLTSGEKSKRGVLVKWCMA